MGEEHAMEHTEAGSSRQVSRRTIFEMVAGVAIIGIAFAAISLTDVSSVSSLVYWNALIILVGIAAVANGYLHAGVSLRDYRALARILAHWLAVLVVVHMVFLLVSTGRMANADVGLTCGTVVTLGTVLDGVHGNWRMVLLGLALGLLTLGMALVEQYLWVVTGVSILTIVVLLLGARFTRNRKADADRVSP